MVAEFSIVPMGKGTRIGRGLAPVMRMVDDSGLDYRVGSMCTVVEGTWDEVMRLVRRCHQAMLQKSPRVITSIKLDDRRGARGRIEGKVRSVIRSSGRVLRH